MATVNASLPNSSQVNWQILAELSLTAESDPEEAVKKWLAEAISPLDLDRSLKNKLLITAPETAAGATKLDNAGRPSHLHFLIMIPRVYEDRGQAWGFFRLVKTGGSTQGALDQMIEIYLYPEGS